jgi:hypothetical protein
MHIPSIVRNRRSIAAATALGLFAAAAVSYNLQAATNPSHTIHVACTHQYGTTELDVDHIASGPDSTTNGAGATLVLEAHETTFPSQSGSVAVDSYEDVTTRVVADGVTVNSASISQPGSVDATVSVDGNTVTIVIPGPVAGGATITTPEITIDTSVTAAQGGSVTLAPGSPFYAVRANTSAVGAVNVSCEPADDTQRANATLTVPVGAPDTSPPSITFIEPNESSVYGFGEEIAAAYTCSDQSTPVTCEGTVPNGEPLDTTSSGVHEFAVTATDSLGNTATETIEYVVLPEGAPPPDRPGYTALDPARLLDTREGPVADTVDDAHLGGGKSAGGNTVELQVAGRGGVPEDAMGVVLNVTATENEGPGHVTAYPCGEERPLTSNLNYSVADDVRPNAAIARLSDDGKVCLYTFGAATHLVVDVNGYFPFGARFASFNPGRLLDTRADHDTIDGVEQDGATAAGGEIVLQVAGRHNVPDSAVAAILNVTALSAGGPGFATLYPCDEQRPTSSNVNFGADEGAVANMVVSKLSGDGTVCLFTGVSGADLIVDVSGYLPSGAEYVSLNPGRLLDTRPDRPTVDGADAGAGKPVVGEPLELQIGGRHGVDGDASAVVLNVTATEVDGAGYFKVYPCGTEPNASSVNFAAPMQTRANAVIAKLSPTGTVCIVAKPMSGHVVVDVSGFVPAQSTNPPPPPPPSTTTTTTTTLPGATTTTTTTEPGATTTTIPAACPDQALYDELLAQYNQIPPLLLPIAGPPILLLMAQLDENGDGNACNDPDD